MGKASSWGGPPGQVPLREVHCAMQKRGVSPSYMPTVCLLVLVACFCILHLWPSQVDIPNTAQHPSELEQLLSRPSRSAFQRAQRLRARTVAIARAQGRSPVEQDALRGWDLDEDKPASLLSDDAEDVIPISSGGNHVGAVTPHKDAENQHSDTSLKATASSSDVGASITPTKELKRRMLQWSSVRMPFRCLPNPSAAWGPLLHEGQHPE